MTHFSTSLVKSKFYASICEFWLTHGAHYSLDNMHQTNLSRCNFRGRRKKKKDPRVEMRRNIDDQILTRTHVQLPFQKATPSSVTWKTYEEICYRYNKTINAVAVQYLLQFQDNSVTAFFSKPRGDLAYVLRSLALVSVSTFVRSESRRNVYSVAFTRSTETCIFIVLLDFLQGLKNSRKKVYLWQFVILYALKDQSSYVRWGDECNTLHYYALIR